MDVWTRPLTASLSPALCSQPVRLTVLSSGVVRAKLVVTDDGHKYHLVSCHSGVIWHFLQSCPVSSISQVSGSMKVRPYVDTCDNAYSYQEFLVDTITTTTDSISVSVSASASAPKAIHLLIYKYIYSKQNHPHLVSMKLELSKFEERFSNLWRKISKYIIRYCIINIGHSILTIFFLFLSL
ncbi:hypothetical protein BDB01DRAFT_246487 [Pilobolus umbonatus]|nr:hypothetical protein BDB01DRAFT_246487 [Pilobolus umbonatus]